MQRREVSKPVSLRVSIKLPYHKQQPLRLLGLCDFALNLVTPSLITSLSDFLPTIDNT